MPKRNHDGDIIFKPVSGLKRSAFCIAAGALSPKRAKHYEYWHHADLTREERAAHMAHIYANLLISKN